MLDGRSARPRDAVHGGAQLSLSAELQSEVSWVAQSLPLNILYEDEELLVIDKPAGLVVHPGAGNHHGTLVNALLSHRPALESVPRGGIVHRLDKETSGLLVVAGTLNAHRSLVAQLQKKDVQREYFAIVRGVPSGGGRIETAIGRHPRQRTRMAVVPNSGKPAVTHYRIAQRFAQYTALSVQLETGRTHQIRVHMAHRGYPLLGDPVYGGRLQLPRACSERLAETLRGFRRQALHARRLSFIHPGSGDLCSFESPLADDLQGLLQVLAEENPSDSGQSLGLL
ncbi:ribosomal large subunit pseudouridine synthase D [gamma proteobacterium NOR5-3]|nr:ribosomal large subunit pseudouridine synthase D [gamma proteobacterium NOR5-3]